MENKILTSQELQNMMGDLLVINKSSMESNELMKAEVTQTKRLVTGLANQYNDLADDVNGIKDRMTNLELNEEVTDEQRNKINEKCRSRVAEVLEHDGELIDKYYRTYVMNLYSSLKKNYGMGAKITTTKKRNYDNVMRGIQAWYPDHEKLRERVNRKLRYKNK